MVTHTHNCLRARCGQELRQDWRVEGIFNEIGLMHKVVLLHRSPACPCMRVHRPLHASTGSHTFPPPPLQPPPTSGSLRRKETSRLTLDSPARPARAWATSAVQRLIAAASHGTSSPGAGAVPDQNPRAAPRPRTTRRGVAAAGYRFLDCESCSGAPCSFPTRFAVEVLLVL
jgi:hypothetical protein